MVLTLCLCPGFPGILEDPEVLRWARKLQAKEFLFQTW